MVSCDFTELDMRAQEGGGKFGKWDNSGVNAWKKKWRWWSGASNDYVCPAATAAFWFAQVEITERQTETCSKYDKEPKWHFMLLTCMTFREMYLAFFLLIVLTFCSPFTVFTIAFFPISGQQWTRKGCVGERFGFTSSLFQLVGE